ncbi:hypothetical protein KFZ76_00655 [Methylovulum psychrotolerans]|uniref:hypothetical protein n=1 Tax=Methylovulum psychrotolerans TaxID=1704499 RepID=UPI001BFFCC8D|nr:hypothetical protein [Methylovulum psychrotolerans]MBT9096218.1 hypothetical protein [Methylovulum psychrotolerans]
MKVLLFTIYLIVLLLAPIVESKEIGNDEDYIRIYHIPSKGAFLAGTPTVEIKADTLSQHNNYELKNFYLRAKAIASYPELKMRTFKLQTGAMMVDNFTTDFHAASTSIEIGNKGDSLVLVYDGRSNVSEYQRYEQDWLVLYRDISRYLQDKMSIK